MAPRLYYSEPGVYECQPAEDRWLENAAGERSALELRIMQAHILQAAENVRRALSQKGIIS
jgi:hypothetical protein